MKSAFKNEKLLIKPSGGGAVSVALVYPNRYMVGMASLGFQSVWSILNAIPGVYCERAFAPSPASGRARKDAAEAIRVIESSRPAADFDIIAFSLSYELDAINMLRSLRASGVPLQTRKRKDRHPIVLLGGVAPTINPEPYANFADIILIGEAEEVLPLLFSRVIGARGSPRKKLLAEAAKAPGTYVPSFYSIEYGDGVEIKSRCANKRGAPEVIERQWVGDLDKSPCHSVIVAPEARFGDMALMEIARGCGRGCRFCAAGFLYRPPRARSLKALKPSIDVLLEHWNRIGLVASSGTDHPHIEQIIDYIIGKGGQVSLASLRVDNLSEHTLKAVAQSSQGITVAPEAGSDRLRRVTGKAIDKWEIIDAAERIGRAGIRTVKLYFLVGLPTETMDDAMEIAELTGGIAKAHRGRGRRSSRISVSVAPFVPKPNTPFSLHPMERADALRERVKGLRALLRKIPGVEARFESVDEALFQAALSRGDRRAGQLIKDAADAGGSVRRALKTPPQWLNDSLYKQRNVEASTPWEFIDSHIGLDYIYSEYHQGLTARKVNPCRPFKCASCEACRARERGRPARNRRLSK